MTLRTRVAIVCLLIALPVAAVATFVVDRMRTADARLALKAGDRSRIFHPIRRQNLQGHGPIEPGIPREIDPPHPSLTNQILKDIASHRETIEPPR